MKCNVDEKNMRKEIEQLEKQLAFVQKKYRLVIDNIDCAVWEYDCETHYLHQEKKLGGKYEDENLDIPDYRNTIRSWGMVHPEDIAVFEAYCDSMDRGDESYCYEFRTLTDDETYTWQRYEGNTIRDEEGNIIKIIGKTLNVDKEYREREELRLQSQKDSLTGILNKGAFQEEMIRLFSCCQKGLSGEQHAIYIMDIDNFKGVNDTYGHMFGDYVLEQYAGQIREILGEQDVIGRIGGDEFAIIKKGISSRFEVENYAKRLNGRVREMRLMNDANITTSIGISIYPTDGVEYEEIFHASDTALYQVKNNGKDGYAFYNTAMKGITHTKKQLTAGMTESSKRKESVQESAGPYEDTRYRELEDQIQKLQQEIYYSRQLMQEHFDFYVVEEDYSLVYQNSSRAGVGIVCYRQRGLDAPCQDCPVSHMSGYDKQFSVKGYDSKSKRWYFKMALRTRGTENQIQYIVCKEDVTHLLEQRNIEDGLTNLASAEYFEIEVAKILSETKQTYCMVFMGYKNYNRICRQFGYKAGDDILKAAGKQIRYSLVEGEQAARIQGRNFVLLLKKETSIYDRIHMIMKILQHECEKSYSGIFAYMESGIYEIEKNTMLPVIAIDYAEYAKRSLYTLKDRGKNELSFFEEDIKVQYQKEKTIRKSMYQAFLDEKFEIRFWIEEGKESLEDAGLYSVWMEDAAVLWRQEDYLLAFEMTQFICDFDLYLCERVFSCLQNWRQAGKRIPLIMWSMTYSVFWDRSFGDKLWELAKRYDIPCNRFEVRILKRKFVGREDALEEITGIFVKKGFPVFVTEEDTLQESGRVLVQADELEGLLRNAEEKSIK